MAVPLRKSTKRRGTLQGARLTPRMRAHAALGHAGRTRVELSNIVIHGKPVATIQEPSQCRACRLMHKAPVTKQSRRVPPRRGARAELTFKGERIYTDHSTSHEPGWPIKFTSIVNFTDDYTKDSDFMFTMTKSLTEVASALREYVAQERASVQGRQGVLLEGGQRARVSWRAHRRPRRRRDAQLVVTSASSACRTRATATPRPSAR